MTAVPAAAARLRDQRAAALATQADPEQVALEAAAGAVGLLAATLAGDAEQVAEVGRVLTDLAAPQTAAEPARALLTLCLLTARQALGSHEEAAAAMAQAWQTAVSQVPAGCPPEAAQVAGAARLLLLTASWLDRDLTAATSLARAESELAHVADLAGAGCALAAALATLAALVGAEASPHDGLAGAFESALAVAVTVAAEPA